MGTNFYAVLPVKKKVTKNLEKAIELINNTPYDIDAIEAEISEVRGYSSMRAMPRRRASSFIGMRLW